MTKRGPSDPDTTGKGKEILSISKMRNAVILPDGTKKEPLGSGVITGILGVGGMANVYEIWNNQLEVSRAVKLLHPNYTEETRQRFQTEIKITAKLHHPNIIEIHAVGYWNSLPFIEMERISGQTLEKIIEERGALPVEVCSSIAIMIGRALRYAHNQEYVIYGTTYHGVIHRDLKPSNIMVAENGVVKLMDFGIARPTDASIHTTDGAILGTMQYLSPEQLDGKNPDIRTDIYSLGTILYELLTGVKAFPENNISKLMLSKIKNDFRPLDAFDLKVPKRLRKLVHRCMVYDREKRIPDAMTFLSEVGKIHRTICGRSAEKVLLQYLEQEEVIRTEVMTRRMLPKNALVAGVLVGLLSVGIWQAGRYASRKGDAAGEDASAEITVAPVRDMREPETGGTVSQKEIPAKESKKENEVTKPGVRKTKRTGPPLRSSDEKKPEVKKPPSFVDALKEKYGTDDLLLIFTKEIQRGNHADALKLFDRLSPDAAVTNRAVIFRIRALKGAGRNRQLRAVLTGKTVNDGEFFLERARAALEEGSYSSVSRNLQLCERTPAAFMESGLLRIERLYLEARAATGDFYHDNSDISRRHALDRWFEVKSELRTSRDHPYFREADREMQRITRK